MGGDKIQIRLRDVIVLFDPPGECSPEKDCCR